MVIKKRICNLKSGQMKIQQTAFKSHVKVDMIKRKQGQMKIQQTAFVLIAVVIFASLAGIFFLSFKISSTKGVANELLERESMLLVSKLANSPEFSCERSFENKINCVDFDKMMVLKGEKTYSDFWGLDNIEARIIYPEMGGETPCTKLNYPACNLIKIIDKEAIGFDSSNYVTICRKEKNDRQIYDKCEIGLLSIRYKPK